MASSHHVVMAMDKSSGRIRSVRIWCPAVSCMYGNQERSDGRGLGKLANVLDKCEDENVKEWSTIKGNVRDALGKFLFEKTRRRPVVLPIIMEIN